MKADEARFESLSPIRKALLTIERLQSKLDALERSRQEPIAVIGLGCRFPGGADGPEAFWRLLCEGRDAVTEVPANRFDMSEIYDGDSDAPGKLYMRTGGFLDWVDGFDAPFFRISPREASQMDPQQRLFLEVSWEALENAGQPPDGLVGTRTGVFAGILSEDYAHLPGQLSERIDAYYYPGINGSFIAGRLSYFLGLHGPSIVVDTACSSSLVAVHLACQSLRTGETDMALAGGVNLILSPEVSMFLCKARAMSPTGRCRAFDKLADGMIRGEGCGVVVLKRLSDAVRAADEVLAIIRGSAANHDGASGGLTVPNPEAQELLYRDAMRSAGVRPHEVSYVEAHGTGTHLGDPIELRGLSAAYCDGRAADRPLWIGSVKTNIGHTDSAAGIANLIKTVLILRNGMIPPTLHFTEPNPQFPWTRFPIAVADRLMPLGPSSTPHLAGVTAFGLSGVNAHVILQQAPAAEVETPPPRPHGDRRACLLPVSAKSPEALRELVVSYRDLLSTGQDDPEDVCAAAATRRSCHDVRLVVVGETRGELVEGLDAFLRNENSTAIATGSCDPDHAPRLAFLFSGQGPQWWAMGRELMAGEAVFREAIERIEEIFSRESGWSILSELTADESRSHIHNTEVAQPAMFAMQVALAELWKHWGVLPDGVVGHSMGEVAAAHAAGVLTLEDAVRVIYHRGRLLERATGRGKMAAANLSYDDARQLVEDSGGGISIAAHNGPSSFVLSGDERAMDRTLAVLNAKGIYCRELHVKFASHCPQMDAYQAEFEAVLEGIRPRTPSVLLLSTVTGRRAASDDFLPSYWARNIREPVLFATTIDGLIDDGFDAFLEIDPHPILGGSISQCLESRGRTGLVLKSLHRETGERRAMLESLATLHVHGHAIDRSVIFGRQSRHVALPTYPWQRKRYWLKAGADSRTGTASLSPERGDSDRLLGERIESPLEEIQFRSSVRASSPDYLEGHRIAGQVVFPGSAYQVMALSAAEAIDRSATEVRNLTFLAPLILSERWSDLHLVVGPADPRGERAVRVYGRGSATDVPTWTLHAAGIIARVSGKDATAAETPDLEAVRRRCEEGSVDDFYRDVAARGYQYSGSFRCIEAIWKGRDEVLSRLRLPDGPGTGRESRSVHPALLDGCMHSILAAVDFAGADDLFVPIDVGRMRVLSPPGTVAWAHGVMRRCAGDDGDALRADLRVFDSAGRLCVEVTDLSLRHSRSWTLREGGRVPSGGWCYEVAWTPKPIDSFARSARARGSWILLSDGGPVGASLVRALEATGQDLLLVQTGDRCEAAGSTAWTLNVRDPDDVRSLFRRIRDAEMVCSDVVYLAAAGPADESSSGESIEAGQDALCGGVLHLVQAIEQADLKTTPRLWLITQNAQATGRDEPPLDPRQATLWGLARVIRLEHPGLGCACLDLDARGGGNQSSLVVREIRTNDGETQVAFRRGVRLVARLARHVLPSRAATDSEAPRRVGISSYGVLDDLALRPMERRPTGPDEVEIRVRVTGLNFRDVLNALGMLEADAREIGITSASEMPFGHECAGEIVTVGRNVAGFRVGDEVIAAMATGSLGSFVTVPAGFVVPRPPQLSREEAVTLPVAFLTAYRALHHLAKIRPGDRVLIHCAAGGVGQAAVQLARRAGARVFATASPGKWEFVRSLGVERVMNSRSVDFAAELMQATAGAGVDVVLNSLNGEFISKSFDVCAPGARFVEIGRIDILGEGEAREKRPDVAYFPLALPEVARTDPTLIGSMLREIVRLASERELTPLPRTTYPIGSVVDAFRFMAQGKHIGKVVVTQADDGGGRADRRIRGDATYLISGGLGALGLRVARWLVGRGARNLILAGRRGPAGTAASEISDLERDGVRVVVALADVARRDDVDRVLGEVASGMPPLRGVFHAAVVLDDGVLMQQNLERFHKVLAAKVAGAWNLHVLTQDLPLDHFVCFSSAVALLGSPGQGNYAAANAFLDALAHHRRSRGLPGLSVNWGPWAESGLAAGLNARDQARWATRGLEAIPPDQGLEVLGRLLAGSAAQVAVLPVDWSKYLAQLSAPWSFLDDLSPASGAPKDETPDLLRELERTPAAERREMLAAHVRHQVARVLGLTSPETIRLRQRLFDFGLDSLMALELRNRLARSVGRSLRSTLVFDYPTVEALVEYLAENVLSRETDSEVSGEPTGEGAAGTRASDLLDQLSGEELADLLAGELSNRSEGDTP